VLFNIDGEVKGELVFCAGPPVLLAAGACSRIAFIVQNRLERLPSRSTIDLR
jgi:hypothetical protein